MTPEELRRLADDIDPKQGMASGIAIPFNERQKREHKAATALREYAESLELEPVENQPTQSMCRAAVEYMNGADIYSKAPAECLEIEEGIYAEVWKAMQANQPNPESAIKQRLTTEPPKMTEVEIGDIWFDLDGEASRLFLRKLNAFADAICEARDKQWADVAQDVKP